MCGAVAYRVTGPLRDVINCHCSRCRRSTGHFMAATACATDDLTMTEDSTLRWYQGSEVASYGFCSRCGSTLFWRSTESPEQVSIAAGTLDAPTELSTQVAIFLDSASDYHHLDPDIPHQHRQNRPK